MNDKGFIINSDQSLLNKAGVYIYQSILDPEKFYIGSTYDLYIRFNQHRTLVINRFTDCPKFYNHVQKYGWENLRFGICEPTVREQHSGKDIKEIRKIITDREQNYFKLYSPSLNVNPEANSRLGAKFSEASRKKVSEAKSGINHHLFGKTHSKATRQKISLAQLGKTNSFL